jgi:phosphate/sulfate permease
VRWGVAGHIVLGWVFTIPACFMLAWAIRSVIKALFV